MINVVMAFALGLIIGGIGGVVVMAMLQIAGDADERNARSTGD